MRHHRRLIRSSAVGLLVLFALSGCTSSSERTPSPPAEAPSETTQAAEPPAETNPAPAEPEQTAPVPENVTSVLKQALSRSGELLPKEVREQLGTPQRVETEAVKNEHDPSQIDTLRTLIYDGLQIKFYDVSQSQKSLLMHITMTGDQYAGPEGLRTGLSRSEVRNLLGSPTETKGEELVFEEGDPTPIVTTVHFSDGTADRIEWSFYVD